MTATPAPAPDGQALGHWVVSHVSEPATAHDTEAAANRAADGLKGAVVWFCSMGAQADVIAPLSDSGGTVAPGATDDATGPQIGTQRAVGVVERVLGHLGVVLPTNGEIA